MFLTFYASAGRPFFAVVDERQARKFFGRHSGGWGSWSSYSRCDCKTLVTAKHRICDNPMPHPLSLGCSGDGREVSPCKPSGCFKIGEGIEAKIYTGATPIKRHKPGDNAVFRADFMPGDFPELEKGSVAWRINGVLLSKTPNATFTRRVRSRDTGLWEYTLDYYRPK